MRTTHDRTSDPADATTRGQTMKAARHARSPARRAVLAATLVVGGGIPSLTADGGFGGTADFGSGVVGCGR